MGYAIKTKDLIKKYKDKTAVDGLTLTVNEGELIALLGVNGAGKTTTVKMLTCLTKPTEGKASIMMVIEYRKLKADIKVINELSADEE